MIKRRRKDTDNHIENKNKLNMDISTNDTKNDNNRYNLRNKSINKTNKESNNELNKLHTIHNFYKIFVPKFIQNLELYRKKIRKITKKLISESKSDDISNIFNSEFKYHTKSRDSNDLARLNYFETSNMIQDFKLMTDRTLQLIYENTFEDLDIGFKIDNEIKEKEYFNLDNSDDDNSDNENLYDNYSDNENLDDNNSDKMNIDDNDSDKMNIDDNDSDKMNNNNQDKIILQKIKKLLRKGFGNFIYKLIIDSQEVTEYFEPIIKNIHSYCQKQLDIVNSIPFIEQKTEAWFKMRENMISASVCGYIDSKRCGCGRSKETEQILEKTYLKEKKKFSWNTRPLRHGQQFEDLTVAFYELFNEVTNKEYGIIPDTKNDFIGASPDGLIIDVHNSKFSKIRKKYRMLEIKNPVSAKINHQITNYYYYQMMQQMYVCSLPLCDFLRTQFRYDRHTSFDSFSSDKLDINIFKKIESWDVLSSYVSSYVLDNLNFKDGMLDILNNLIQNTDIDNFESEFISLVINNFDKISPIPFNNLDSNGLAKGILWCFTKEIGGGDVEFKIEYTPLNQVFNTIDDVDKYYTQISQKHLQNGFNISECHYWRCEIYSEIEVEYNQGLYEGFKNTELLDDTIFKRLKQKWDIINELRGIKNIDERSIKYYEYYPEQKNDYSESFQDNKNKKKKYVKKNKKSFNNSKGRFDASDNGTDYDLS